MRWTPLALALIAAHSARAGDGPAPAAAVLVRSVRPAAPPEGAKILAYGLCPADVERIRAEVPAVRIAAPFLEIPVSLRAAGSPGPVPTTVVGITGDYPAIEGLDVAVGRPLVAADDERYENVAVLGAEAARRLFPAEGGSPIGRSVKVGPDYYTIVGVLTPRSGSIAGPDRKGLDLDVFVPLNTLRLRMGARRPPEPGGSGPAEECELSGVVFVVDGPPEPGTKGAIEAVARRLHPRGDVATSAVRRARKP